MSLIVGLDDCSSESDVIVAPSALDFVSQDDMLTPLGRLDKYAASENVFNRCDASTHLPVVSAEPTVRAELMEQVPHIALFCQENRPAIPYAFSKYLLPIVVRYLADQNNQVRKTSQAALLALLEQELIERFDVETKVCPVLVDLTAPDSNDDVKTEAVAIMCKMAPMVGKDITERLILPRFCEMCCDCRMFHVRKVCAANFGDICSVVGQQATEEMLLPRFFQLCSDNVWGVRKASTSHTQTHTLLQITSGTAFQSLGPFISTFANPSSSGQYFKEENKSSEDTSVEDKNSSERTRGADAPEDIEARPTGGDSSVHLEEALADGAETPSELSAPAESSSPHRSSPEPPPDAAGSEEEQEACACRLASQPEADTGAQDSAPLDQEQYNSFHFWRTPLPEIDLDVELEQGSGSEPSPQGLDVEPEVPAPGPASITMATRKELEEMIENLEPHIDDPDVKAQVDVLAAALRASSLDAGDEASEAARRVPQDELPSCRLDHDASGPLISEEVRVPRGGHMFSGGRGAHPGHLVPPFCIKSPRVISDVVPQALLDQYLSMTDPSRAQTVDTEIAKHCAYSLPGVALTLGRQNWHCLRETYETLASDMQWKVRRTLAFSIHELAVILGDQLTAADLVPIFNGFLKDLDEVRIGVLKHLHDFLKLLHIDKRREYLYQLQEFLVTDNSRNWRFRAELAEQLILLLELYSPRDVYDYLRPIALNLCADKVSSVRWISYKLVSEMVRKLHRAAPPTFGADLIQELVESFGRCPRWSGRQAFVFVCQTVIEDDCLPMDQFAVQLMPHLLTLANDRVPNVRVLLAKTLRQTLLEKEHFLTSASCHQEAVEQTIMALQMDRDSDVKYFASTHPASTRISEDALSTASSTY
uniref:Putative WW-binding domain-containing protein n=1 Tax=Capra hircus TaxID=9925 RepID=A0A8C2SF11_CAPHI